MSGIKRMIEAQADNDTDGFVPSCFTCKHVKMWSHAATREEPADEGYECNHPDQELINANFVEPPLEVEDTPEAMAIYCAQDCPGYEFFDWNAHYAAQDDAYANELQAQAKIAQTYRELGL